MYHLFLKNNFDDVIKQFTDFVEMESFIKDYIKSNKSDWLKVKAFNGNIVDFDFSKETTLLINSTEDDEEEDYEEEGKLYHFVFDEGFAFVSFFGTLDKFTRKFSRCASIDGDRLWIIDGESCPIRVEKIEKMHITLKV